VENLDSLLSKSTDGDNVGNTADPSRFNIVMMRSYHNLVTSGGCVEIIIFLFSLSNADRSNSLESLRGSAAFNPDKD